jgi:hypothetical protein
MSLYTPSKFLTLLKQDIGIKGIPLPVDDKAMYERFTESALKEFSIISPRITRFMINDNERVDKQLITNASIYPIKYKIPKDKYIDVEVLYVLKVDVRNPYSNNSVYFPQSNWASADSVLSSIADIRVAAGIASSMGRAPTFEFEPPNIIYLYNGWSAGNYEVIMGTTHDPSLATIHPSHFTHLRKLGVLDLQEFLYNELSRINELDVGIGQINLKIESWESSGDKKQELLNEWREDANLSMDYMQYF